VVQHPVRRFLPEVIIGFAKKKWMLIIRHVVTNETISSTLIYLWAAVLLVLVLWLMVRRWRQQTEEGVYDTAVQRPPLFPLTAQTHKQIIATMLPGGLLLLVLGQISFTQLEPPASWGVIGLMALGGGLFLWAGSRVRRDSLADDRLAVGLHRLGHWLGVAGWQALLLGLAFVFTVLARLTAGDLALARRWDVSVVAWLLALSFTLAGGVPLSEWRKWLLGVVVFAGFVYGGVAAAGNGRYPVPQYLFRRRRIGRASRRTLFAG
jgi:hypothetical protein